MVGFNDLKKVYTLNVIHILVECNHFAEKR